MKKILYPTILHTAKQIFNLANVGTKQPFLRYCKTSPKRPTEIFLKEANVDSLPSGTELPAGRKKLITISHKKTSVEDVPLNKILATTNKMLFGPLLETAQEKKRRLKRESLGKEDMKPPKKQKKKKREEKPIYQPLILTPENSHYMHISDKNTVYENDSRGTDSNLIPKNKKVITLVSKSDIISKLEESSLYSHQSEAKSESNTYPKRKRIIFISGVHSAEKNVPLLNKALLKENAKVLDISVVDKMDEHPKVLYESTGHGQNALSPFSNIKSYQNIASDVNLIDSILDINNSKFTAVPQTLDINAMENFPLFNNVMPTYTEEQKDRSNIISIGIFEGGYQRLPSVRKILDETMPRANRIALERWKAKLVKELGEEGFNAYREGLLSRGKLLHSCIQSELSGGQVLEESVLPAENLWMSVKTALPRVSNVQVLESRLIHPYLYYQGAVDCIASYRGIPVLIEWKTSTKPKLSVKSMFDDPLQVVAYLGALNFDSNYKLPQPIESALLVVAYESGLPAHVHMLQKEDCQVYWRLWCSRLSQFWKNHDPGITPNN